MTFTPTAEQQKIIDACATSENLVIEAGAGAGKTATLKLAAEGMKGKGLYAAFNKAIADEAKSKFPAHVDCRTVHSLAFAQVGKHFKHRLNGPRQSSKDVALKLGVLEPLRLGKDFTLQPGQQARLAIDGVDRFCNSNDSEILPRHVPKLNGLEDEQNAAIQEFIEPLAREIWDDLKTPDGTRFKFTHSCYLKIFAMGRPSLPYDFILLDEAQDTNPVVSGLMLSQSNAQQIAVGDPAQAIYCQPIGTLVSVPGSPGGRWNGPSEPGQVPIENIQVGDKVVTYSNSHVFKTGRPITSVTRFPYEGRMVRVTTDSDRTSAYTPKHHCVVRAGRDIEDKHVVYLMQRGEHFRAGRVPFRYKSQGGAFGVALRAKAKFAEAAWILSVHDTVKEAALAEALVQHRFNLPGVRFEPTTERDVLDVREFWQKCDSNREGAERCLEEHGRLIEFPIWTPGKGQLVGIRRPFVTAAANLIDGFKVLPLGNEVHHRGKRDYSAPASRWEPISVSHEWYSGEIVSLEVADHHTYYGDGILTHNSWRGAVNAMETWPADQRLRLSRSFRFGQQIANEGNKWLWMLGTDMRISGTGESTVGPLANADAVLTRTNGAAVGEVLSSQGRHQRVALVGGGQQIKQLAQASDDLQAGRGTSHPELVAFKTWDDVREYVQNDSTGSDLKAFVKLIDSHGTATVIRAMDQLADERRADVTVSTAHKAKGREWPRVRIGNDFHEPMDSEGNPAPVPAEECRLAYVAVTRGREHVDIGGLSWINDRTPTQPRPVATGVEA